MWWRNYSQTLGIQVFIVYQVDCYLKILKLSCITLAVTLQKAFSKNQKELGLELVVLPLFLHDF